MIMSRFKKPGAGNKEESGKKKGHSSPMQKKGWVTRMDSYEDAVPLLVNHVSKGATWSGDELWYLNALWDAVDAVARDLGYIDQE